MLHSAPVSNKRTRRRRGEVEPTAYPDFLRAQCTAETATFKNALVSFDVKNGVKRGQASSDADLQIDDYIAGSADNYGSRFAAMKPKAAAQPAAAAPAQTASVPK